MAGVDSGRRVHALIEVMVALHAIVIVVMKYAIAMAQYNIIRIFTADQRTFVVPQNRHRVSVRPLNHRQPSLG